MSSGFEAVIPGTRRTFSMPNSTKGAHRTSSSCTAMKRTHRGIAGSAFLAAKLTPWWPTNISGVLRSARGAGRAFLPVLHLRLLDRLPLHVARRIGSAGTQRNDMIHDVAVSATRVAGALHEPVPRRTATRRPSTRVG